MDAQQLEALKKAHKTLGNCLDGSCDHHGVGKCMAQIKSAHSTMGGIIGSEEADATENEKYAAISANDPGLIQKTVRAIYSASPVCVD